MANFSYRAIQPDGTAVVGAIESANSASAVVQLQRQRLYPLHVSRRRTFGRLSLPRLGAGKALLVASSELRALVGAGMMVDRALGIVLERCPDDRLTRTLGQVRQAIRGGKTLADALSEASKTFSPVYVALVRAGEASGRLDDALARVDDYLVRQDATRNRIGAAMVYPCILLCAAAASLLLLSDVVLPQFLPMFEQAGKQLPLATRVVVFISDLIDGASLPLVGATILVFAISRQVLRDPRRLLAVHRMLLRLPVIGRLWRNLEAARFARAAGTLLEGGLSVPLTVAISTGVLANASIRQGVEDALTWLREGAPLSEALRRARVMPTLSIQLIAIGEETGRLDTMLLEQAELLDQEAERRLSLLLSLAVPGLTVAVGLVVGSVMVAIMLAVLRLNELAG